MLGKNSIGTKLETSFSCFFMRTTKTEPARFSWTDDWRQHDIVPSDIASASSSLAVPDLDTALRRLTEFSLHKGAVNDRWATALLTPMHLPPSAGL